MKENKQLIIGLGTGRCGTVSLTNLLVAQGVNATHENIRLPWLFSDEIDTVLNDIISRNENRVSDTALYYLPYIPHIIDKYPNTKFICLRRNKKDTVNSYIRKTQGRNHWSMEHDMIPNIWDKFYPTYKITDKREAIEYYWDEYYLQAIEYESLYPNSFKIFQTEDVLNKRLSQLELFKFLGIDNYQIVLNIKENVDSR